MITATNKQINALSRFLSLVLRHKPEAIGLQLDKNGWVDVSTLLEKLTLHGTQINQGILTYIVETNPKKRFSFNETLDKIRASQGHSLEVELGHLNQEPPEFLFHGTAKKSIQAILNKGIRKQNRTHVHLSDDLQTAIEVGKRHGRPFVFKVLSGKMFKDNFMFFLSDNNVWLTDNVPSKYLVKTEQARVLTT